MPGFRTTCTALVMLSILGANGHVYANEPIRLSDSQLDKVSASGPIALSLLAFAATVGIFVYLANEVGSNPENFIDESNPQAFGNVNYKVLQPRARELAVVGGSIANTVASPETSFLEILTGQFRDLELSRIEQSTTNFSGDGTGNGVDNSLPTINAPPPQVNGGAQSGGSGVTQIPISIEQF